MLIWAVSVSAFGKALATGAIEGTSKLMDKYYNQPAPRPQQSPHTDGQVRVLSQKTK